MCLISAPRNGGDGYLQSTEPEIRRKCPALGQTVPSHVHLLHLGPEVLEEIGACIAPGGLLLLSSNVEDVALTLLRHAEGAGFEALEVAPPELPAVASDSLGARAGDAGGSVPLRQQRWREARRERADGACWRAARLFHDTPKPFITNDAGTNVSGKKNNQFECNNYGSSGTSASKRIACDFKT